MSVDYTTERKDDSTKQRTVTRRMANNAPEAKLQTRALHSRVPPWKISNCIQALNAQPIDLTHIAEVTEIQFASNDLVVVAAKCLCLHLFWLAVVYMAEQAVHTYFLTHAMTMGPTDSLSHS